MEFGEVELPGRRRQKKNREKIIYEQKLEQATSQRPPPSGWKYLYGKK
jgi:hypothetical protein